jgi:hypothetical protein
MTMRPFHSSAQQTRFAARIASNPRRFAKATSLTACWSGCWCIRLGMRHEICESRYLRPAWAWSVYALVIRRAESGGRSGSPAPAMSVT